MDEHASRISAKEIVYRGTEWEGDPAEKERETEMERAFRFRGGVPCED